MPERRDLLRPTVLKYRKCCAVQVGNQSLAVVNHRRVQQDLLNLLANHITATPRFLHLPWGCSWLVRGWGLLCRGWRSTRGSIRWLLIIRKGRNDVGDWAVSRTALLAGLLSTLLLGNGLLHPGLLVVRQRRQDVLHRAGRALILLSARRRLWGGTLRAQQRRKHYQECTDKE